MPIIESFTPCNYGTGKRQKENHKAANVQRIMTDCQPRAEITHSEEHERDLSEHCAISNYKCVNSVYTCECVCVCGRECVICIFFLSFSFFLLAVQAPVISQHALQWSPTLYSAVTQQREVPRLDQAKQLDYIIKTRAQLETRGQTPNEKTDKHHLFSHLHLVITGQRRSSPCTRHLLINLTEIQEL